MAAAGPDDPASPFSIRLFGPIDIRLNGSPLPRLRFRKSQWLLALLALRHGAAAATCRWLDPNERAEYERHAASARAALGEEAFAAAWAEGRAMPLERAVRVALEEKEIPTAAPVLPDRCTPLRVAE